MKSVSEISNMSAGVAMTDLDDFKIYNDTFGHDAGELALTTVVGIIKITSDGQIC